MLEWENRLAFRATNRVVRPFDWGLEWTGDWPSAGRLPRNGHAPGDYLRDLNRVILEHSDEFFDYERPRQFDLSGDILTFESPVSTPHAKNNLAHARWFPAKGSKKAVVVLPHWNAILGQHQGLCRGISKLGISALRISLPYHDYRMPPELERADYAVSSNVGRTIDATRQAVIDVRCSLDWLQSRGYERLGIGIGDQSGFLLRVPGQARTTSGSL